MNYHVRFTSFCSVLVLDRLTNHVQTCHAPLYMTKNKNMEQSELCLVRYDYTTTHPTRNRHTQKAQDHLLDISHNWPVQILRIGTIHSTAGKNLTVIGEHEICYTLLYSQ